MPTDSRIHIVHLLYRLGFGGVERQMVSLATHLPRERFRQTFVTAVPRGFRSAELEAAGVELICTPRRGPLDLGYLSAVRRFIREQHPDILNTRGIGSSIWWQLLSRQGPRHPATVVTRSAFEIRASPFTHWLSGQQLRLSDQVVANSRLLQQQLEQRYPALRARVKFIPNGVDLQRFQQAVDRAAVLLREGLDPQLPLVLSLGRLHEVKEFPLLIEAAGQMLESGVPAQFAIVGEGPEREALSRLIEDRELRGKFHLLPARERIEELLLSSDVFVLSSRSESSNNALLEALAAGRACVSTKVSGSPELLADGAHGQLVDIGDAAGLAKAIALYLREPELAADHGSAGREFIREHFNLVDTLAAYAALFEELAADRA